MGRVRTTAATNRDPQPYDGPIQTAYGTRPYNGYLWPTQQWRANDTIRHADYDFRIDLVELSDGLWSTGGFVHEIERGKVLSGHQCCFATRQAALRAQAARVIRRARRASRADVVAWALGVVSDVLGEAIWAHATAIQRAETAARLPTRPALVIVSDPEQPDLFGLAA